MNIVEVSNLTKHFAGVAALEDVTFGVEEGSIHAVIGPNGSGKTTLFNIMSGVYKPTSGEVRLLGHRVDRAHPFEIARRGMGRTFQAPRLFRSMSTLENLLLAGHSSSSWWHFDPGKRAKALETLRFVGLADAADSPAASLPQGQQRLLEIARALCLDPRVLLLDEPHAGLNLVETERLMDVIRALHERGLTVILVEHEMRVVMTLAQRITVLNFGKLLVEGTPSEIQSSPAAIEAYLGSRRRREFHA